MQHRNSVRGDAERPRYFLNVNAYNDYQIWMRVGDVVRRALYIYLWVGK